MPTDFRNDSLGLVFKLYLVYIFSFFIHLTSRISFLGLIRFDLILVGVILLSLLLHVKKGNQITDKVLNSSELDKTSEKCVIIIFALAIVTLPFVEWPGTVLGKGLENLFKAAIFLFFTTALVKTERQLKLFVMLFVFCNVFRVLEPLYLHVTQGYWGSHTYIGEGEFAERLMGSPYDVINSNGLAFVIVSVLPFLHYLFMNDGWFKKLIYFSILPLLLWGMALTLSRTGLLALGIIFISIFLKSKHKALLMLLIVIGSLTFFASLNDLQRDRYLSLTGSESRSAATAQGRFDGVVKNFEVAMRKPIFGHGLGTSREANFNFSGHAQPAHNLYAEIMQELGIVGLAVFLFYIRSIIKNSYKAIAAVRNSNKSSLFLLNVANALQVWLVMNLLFSLASFGLSSYEWYLFAGLSVVIFRIAIHVES